MKSIELSELELVELWQEDTDMDAAVNFPFTPAFPATTGIEADDFTVVYTELEPGKEVGTHTESTEELFVLLDGTVAVSIGDEREQLSAGSMALIPATEPHRIQTVGDKPVRFIGVFPETDVTTAFESSLQPMDRRVFRTVEE